MKRVLHLVPHLSTGGCPQFAYDLIRKTKKYTEAFVVEYSFIAPDFVVQRNKVRELMGERFYSLGDNKNEIFDIIQNVNPDVIHFQEFPEYFMADEIATRIYESQRSYVIVETSHDSSFDPNHKKFFADHLALISQWQIDKFKSYDIPITLLESDIEKYPQVNRSEGLAKLGLSDHQKHVLNVGLWTSRKNQGEIIEYARKIQNSHPNIIFHFVGNQAGNFQNYWEPFMKDLPNNCKVWGERSDVHDFYACMDLFLFTSRGLHGDMETSPLVLREATGHSMPIMMYNLPVYLNQYDNFENITYLDFDDLDKNLNMVIDKLDKPLNNKRLELFSIEFEKESNKIWIKHNYSSIITVSVSVCDVDTRHAIYSVDEMRFENESSAWIIPIPVDSRDNLLNKSGLFRGFEIEIYSHNKRDLIYSKKVFYNNNPAPENLYSFKTNPWNYTWFNYNEMFIDDVYACVKKMVDLKNLVCLDIGANDGLFTEWLLQQQAKKVYAIECDPRATKFLGTKFHAHENVVVIEKALWKENQRQITLNHENDTSTLSSLIVDKVGQTRVDAWNLKTLKNKHNIDKIDFLKIDVEGAEYEILQDLDSNEFKDIPFYLIEYHQNEGNEKLIPLLNKFTQNGYDVEIYKASGEKINPFEATEHGFMISKKNN